MPAKGKKKHTELASDSLLDQLLAESDDDQEQRPLKRRGFLTAGRSKKSKNATTAKRTMSDIVTTTEKPQKAERSHTLDYGLTKSQVAEKAKQGLMGSNTQPQETVSYETQQIITPTEVLSSPPPQTAEEDLFEVELETAEGFRYKRRLTKAQLEELQAEEEARSSHDIDVMERKVDNSESDHENLTDSTSQNSLQLTSKSKSQEDVSFPQVPVILPQETRKLPAKTPERNHDNRGKRVSSLGNGFEGEPHADVDARNFYKHLEPDLPDPHKARLLLAWSGKRAMMNHKTKMVRENAPPGLSETDETTARRIVRVIMEDIIRDIKDGKINTSWYNRPEFDADDSVNARFFKPNAQNIANVEKLTLFTKRLEAQRAEIKEWAQLEAKARENLTTVKERNKALISDLNKPFTSTPEIPAILSDVSLSASLLSRNLDKIEDALSKINSCNIRASKFCNQQFETLDYALESRNKKRPRKSQDFRTIFKDEKLKEPSLNGEQTRDVLRTLSRLK